MQRISVRERVQSFMLNTGLQEALIHQKPRRASTASFRSQVSQSSASFRGDISAMRSLRNHRNSVVLRNKPTPPPKPVKFAPLFSSAPATPPTPPHAPKTPSGSIPAQFVVELLLPNGSSTELLCTSSLTVTGFMKKALKALTRLIHVQTVQEVNLARFDGGTALVMCGDDVIANDDYVQGMDWEP